MTTKTYDALLIPDGYRQGLTTEDRADRINEIARPLLAVDLAAGENAHIRPGVSGGEIFVTKSPYDTVAFPRDHPWEKRPRYTWQPVQDYPGVMGGTLVPYPPNDTP